MINEQEIIRRDEIDLKKIIFRFLRGWPLVAIVTFSFILLGVILLVILPPTYNAKISLLVEKPLGPNDPAIVVSKMPPIHSIDDQYYNNQRMVFRSTPLIKQALDRMGYVNYYKKAAIKKELYTMSPFRVEIDSNYTTFERHLTPYGTPFEVKFTGPGNYNISASGKYPVSKAQFDFEGDYKVGEWVGFDKFRFRLMMADTVSHPKMRLYSDVSKDTYLFILSDPGAVLVDHIDAITIEPEELDASVWSATFSGSVPQKPLDFLTYLGEAFMKDGLEQKTKALDAAIEYLEKQSDEMLQSLIAQEREIEIFKVENELTSVNREGTLLLEQSVKLENDKVPLLVKERYYNYLENYLREQDDYSYMISPQAFGIKDEIMIRLTEEILTLQEEKNNIIAKGNTTNPIFAQINTRIEANKSAIMKSIEGFQKSNKIQIENLSGRIAEIDKSARELPKLQKELIQLERLHRIYEKVYATLIDKKAEAEITRISVMPPYRIVEPPYLTSPDPVFPTTGIILIASVFLGLFISFGALLAKWVFTSTLDDESAAIRHAPSFQHLGVVHFTSIDSPRSLVEYPDSEAAQQFGSILYNTQRLSSGGKVFTVTSFSEQEGKTYMSSMLATKSALSGYNTLYVDANVKNPQGRAMFGVSDSTNLSDCLSKGLGAEEALQGTGIQRLDMMVLGKNTLLNNARTEQIVNAIRSLSAKYDIVVIDTSPINRVSETLQIMKSSDYSVIVARRKKTTNEDLVSLEHMNLKGLIRNAGFAFTETFPIKIRLSPFPKRNAYVRNKPFGLMGRVGYIFKRI